MTKLQNLANKILLDSGDPFRILSLLTSEYFEQKKKKNTLQKSGTTGHQFFTASALIGGHEAGERVQASVLISGHQQNGI